MKNLMLICLSFCAMGASAAFATPLTVHENDIRNKTDLTSNAERSVNGKTENILIDSNGMTLYTFANDSKDVSNCRGGCLAQWPPEHVLANSIVLSPYGKIQGNDGQTQLTLNGLPLYHYINDQKVGDAFGSYPSWDVILVVK